jgi:hypothetical protein
VIIREEEEPMNPTIIPELTINLVFMGYQFGDHWLDWMCLALVYVWLIYQVCMKQVDRK